MEDFGGFCKRKSPEADIYIHLNGRGPPPPRANAKLNPTLETERKSPPGAFCEILMILLRKHKGKITAGGENAGFGFLIRNKNGELKYVIRGIYFY